MSSMQRWLSWSSTMVAAVVLAACSGGDEDHVSLSPAATATPGVAGTQAATAVSPADLFASVLDRLAAAEYRVTYTFTTTTGGRDFTGALTWIRAADGRERFETSSVQGDEGFRQVVITEADGGKITCFAVGGFESCFEGDEGPFAELPDPLHIIFQNVPDPRDVDAVDATGSREVLGLDTTCYEVDVDGGRSQVCISEGNLLLAATWTGVSGDGGSLVATEFSTSVVDTDFDPIVPIGTVEPD